MCHPVRTVPDCFASMHSNGPQPFICWSDSDCQTGCLMCMSHQHFSAHCNICMMVGPCFESVYPRFRNMVIHCKTRMPRLYSSACSSACASSSHPIGCPLPLAQPTAQSRICCQPQWQNQQFTHAPHVDRWSCAVVWYLPGCRTWPASQQRGSGRTVAAAAPDSSTGMLPLKPHTGFVHDHAVRRTTFRLPSR
jgi:hypothetical protein